MKLFFYLCIIVAAGQCAVVKDKLVGDNPCTWGPSYWCASLEAMQNCNTTSYCHEVAKLGNVSVVHNEINLCPQDSSKWCSSPKIEEICGTKAVCDQTRSLIDTSKAIAGANLCIWGPTYWCSSEEAIEECKTRDLCAESNKTYDLATNLIGGEKCTWGPAYWCESKEKSEKCYATDYCKLRKLVEHKHLSNKDLKKNLEAKSTPRPLLGKDKCTWGPAYWCQSAENAAKCHATDYCKNLKPTESKEVPKKDEPVSEKSRPLLGKNKCTWGPGYWCESAENAAKCHATDYCKNLKPTGSKDIQKKDQPAANKSRQLLGEDKCTWGPSYWCESTENAEKCDAIDYCKNLKLKTESKDIPKKDEKDIEKPVKFNLSIHPYNPYLG